MKDPLKLYEEKRFQKFIDSQENHKKNIYEEWIICENNDLDQGRLYLDLYGVFLIKKLMGKKLKNAKMEKKDDAWGIGKHELKIILEMENIENISQLKHIENSMGYKFSK